MVNDDEGKQLFPGLGIRLGSYAGYQRDNDGSRIAMWCRRFIVPWYTVHEDGTLTPWGRFHIDVGTYEEHGLLVTDDKELFVTHYGTDIYLERLGLGVHCSSAEIVHALELQYYNLNWLYTQVRREEDTPFVRGMKSMNDMKPFAIRLELLLTTHMQLHMRRLCPPYRLPICRGLLHYY